MSQFPQSMPSPGVQPHRGTMIMVLGILALVLNFGCGIGWILGIVAWIMGNADLRAMQAGTMDRTGEGMTKAGKICGIVSIALFVIGLLAWIMMMILGIGIAAAGAAAGAGSGGTP